MEGHGVREVMLTPALTVSGVHEGCSAGEPFARGKNIPLPWGFTGVLEKHRWQE